MRLYLVRHPKPQVASGLCYGASDVACSTDELESAASAVLKELPQGLPMISSPLSRCEHFAQILCRREASFAYKTDEKLAEMDFGVWEMQAWDVIAHTELTQWTDAFATYRCGGSGESTGMFVQRVAKRLQMSLQSGEDQVWITHAGVVRAVQWLCGQSWSSIESFIAQPDPAPHLCLGLSQLRAADWPRAEVAFGRVHLGRPWDWPQEWPQG